MVCINYHKFGNFIRVHLYGSSRVFDVKDTGLAEKRRRGKRCCVSLLRTHFAAHLLYLQISCNLTLIMPFSVVPKHRLAVWSIDEFLVEILRLYKNFLYLSTATEKEKLAGQNYFKNVIYIQQPIYIRQLFN